jgi:uracil-DNA glycosylase family 4
VAIIWQRLNNAIERCSLCQRLRDHCRRVAHDKRAAYADWEYWGKPVPNFGEATARLLIVGLAPAAHGANRTGRMFTGDRSGDWLCRALFETGFANQPTSQDRDDGLRLADCAITAACHCAPPGNKPTREEVEHCRGWLEQTFDIVPARVFLALGQIGWQAVLRECRRREWLPKGSARFAHGAVAALTGGRWVVASYHPSQQNTFTGRLTEPMWVGIFRQVRHLLDHAEP